jgi:hypothetical protein
VQDEPVKGAQLGDIVISVLTKGFYGHTLGEILTVALALERAVDEALAEGLGASNWAKDELIEKVLGHVPRDQKIKLLEGVLPVGQGFHTPEGGRLEDRRTVPLRGSIRT